MNKTLPSYFANPPKWCIPGLQAAYDNLCGGQFSDGAVLRGLSRELESIGEKPPTRDEFFAWAKAIAAGDVKRPGGDIDMQVGKSRKRAKGADADAAAKQLPVSDHVEAEVETTSLPPLTPLYSSVETEVASSLRKVRDQMIRDTIARLSEDIPRTATRIVDTQLRALIGKTAVPGDYA